MPYLGDVRAMSFASVPEGWAPCGGQLLPIEQNRALFSLLGTTYGGDGQTTFALPDLPGVPVQNDSTSGLTLDYCICLHGDLPAPAGSGVEPGERRREGIRTIDVYAGEVRAMPYDLVPAGWAPCDERLLGVAEEAALPNRRAYFELPTLAPMAARSGTLEHRIAMDGVFLYVSGGGPKGFLKSGAEYRMSDSLAGETRIFGFNCEPPGWMKCDGRLISVSEYESLFEAIGTTYGGDGQSTFGLPNATGPDFEGKPLSLFINLGVPHFSIDSGDSSGVPTGASGVATKLLYDIRLENASRDFGDVHGMPEEQAHPLIVALLRLYGARPGTKAHVEATAVLSGALKAMPGRPQ
ncbi:phage tail protein [Pyxidicoccus trucidator]|uniref:phage tail protein n=1 Tax=Pyxidicoccus trucidator TaxID=2709662 RepID=UPI001967622E|nr:tail fiber protein [Pyxidicoccus trucidator]